MGNGASSGGEQRLRVNSHNAGLVHRPRGKSIGQRRRQKLELDRYWISQTLPASYRPTGDSVDSVSDLSDSDSEEPYTPTPNQTAASQAFKRHRHDLLLGIENALQLVHYLTSRNILPESTKRRVLLSGQSSTEANHQLLDEIEAQISSNPRVFHSLVSLLQADRMLQVFASRLLDSYRELSNSSSGGGFKSLALPPMQQYAQYLKACYRVQPGLQKCKWFRTPGKTCFNLALIGRKEVNRSEADEFTLASLHECQDDILRTKHSISPTEVLRFEGCGLKGKRILIEGAPGVGKSTLALDYCRQWDESSALKEYKLVVLLKLQDQTVQDAQYLSDLLYHPDATVQHEVAKKAVESDGEGILLVLDGIDQLSQPFQRHKLLLDLLQGYFLPNATLLVTSRPSATEKLQMECGVRFHHTVEILGFTMEEVEQHAENALGSSPSLLNAFHTEYLSKNPFMQNLVHIPLYTAVAVEAFRESRSTGKDPPKTLTDLYRTTLRYLLKHYVLLKGIKGSADNLEKLPRKIEQHLQTLAQLAFTGLTKQETVFFKLPKGCQHMGLMNTTPKIYIGRASATSYTFLHYGLQEYLAALHISKLPTAEQKKILSDYWEMSHFNGVWQFLSGISKPKSSLWEKIRAEIGPDGKISPFLLRCLYEAHRTVPCEVITGQQMLAYPPVQYGHNVLPMHCFMLGCCVAKSACTLSLRVRLSTKLLQALATGFSTAANTISSIETLFLMPPITDETLDWLQEIPPHVIHELDVSHSNLNRETLDKISDITLSLVNLRKLDIRGNPLGSGGMVRLFQTLASINSLQSLSIINTGIGMEDITALSRLIVPRGSLRELKIGDEGLSPEAISDIVTTVFSPSSLQSLHIWLSDLSHNMTPLANLITDNSNLTQLEFHGCAIGNDGSQKLAQALKVNKSVETLIISMFEVPTSFQTGARGAMDFAEMLRVNSTLKHFEISFDKSLGRNGAVALANALQHNLTLDFFKIPQNYFSHIEVLNMDQRAVWS